jgi:hypothetical protein
MNVPDVVEAYGALALDTRFNGHEGVIKALPNDFFTESKS